MNVIEKDWAQQPKAPTPQPRYGKVSLREAVGILFLAFSMGARATTNVDGRVVTVTSSTPTTDYLVTNGGRLTVQPGGSATRIVVRGATMDMNGGTVSSETTGNTAVVELHEGTMTITDSSLTNTGASALIVDANGNANSRTSAAVTTSTLTGATLGASVSAYAALGIVDSDVSGTNATSDGIRVNAGDLSVTQGSTVVGVADGIVFAPDSSAPGRAGTLVLDASTVTGQTGSALVVGGDTGSTEHGATATILVENGATLHGGNGQMLVVHEGSQADFTVDNTSLEGDITVNEGGAADVTMRNAGNVTGAMTGVDSLTLTDSAWMLTGDSTVASINATNGSINTTTRGLTTQSIAGSGSLASDMARVSTAPAVHVTDTMSGQWQVTVADQQHNYAVGELQSSYVVVQVDNGNSATVSGKSDIGAYRYTSQVDAQGNVVILQDADGGGEEPPGGGGGEGGNGGEGGGGSGGSGGGGGANPPPPKPALNSGADAAVDAMSVASVRAIWDTQFSALHLRQQSLRDFTPGPISGTFWAQGYGGDYKLDNGYGSATGDVFDTTVQGVSIGFDKVLHHTQDADLVGGVYASFVNEDRSADESHGGMHGYSVGVYGNWMHRSGWYVDGVLAYGNFNNSFSAAYHGNPAVSTVNADDWRIATAAVAFEVGREFALPDGWAVQPAIGVRYLHQGSQHFTTDLGHQVSSEGIGSTGVNASVTFSKTFRDGGDQYRPYLRVGYADEFAGTQTVHYAGAPINTVVDASRVFVNAGMEAKIAKRHSVFVDYQYEKGHNVENTYLVNVGYRYTF